MAQKRLLERLGLLAVKWTLLERLVQFLAYRFVIDGLSDNARKQVEHKIDIVLSGLSSASLIEQIRVFADEFHKPQLGVHVVHLKGCMNWIREHRNYYLHGISMLSADEQSKGIINAIAVEVDNRAGRQRKRLVARNDYVGREQIDEVINFIQKTEQYLSLFFFALMDRNEEQHEKALDRLKPEIPPALVKSKSFLLDTELMGDIQNAITKND